MANPLRQLLTPVRKAHATYLLLKRPEEVLLTSTPEQQERYARILSGSAKVHPLSIAPVTVVRADQSTLRDLVRAWSGTSRPAALARDLNLDDLLRIEISHAKRGFGRRSTEDAWNLELVGQPDAVHENDGTGVSVAVLDTGIDHRHPEVSGRFGSERGYNAIDGGDTMDRYGHGTHVAGTIAGKRVGMAPGTRLYAVKVLSDTGAGTDGSIMRGIDWASQQGAEVMNMSLGGPGKSYAFQLVIDAAHDAGSTIVAAAGNSGSRTPSYPAAYNHVISVAAVDRNKRRAGFSNMGPTLDIAAPGVDVRSSVPGDGYATYSGTSMASPHVAGASAMLRAAGIDDPEAALVRTAEALGERDLYGAGLLRIDRAFASESSARARALSITKHIMRRYVL